MIPDSQIYKSKILIVDDEAVNVKLLEQMLKNIGFHLFQSTTDPREVVEIYQNYQPDLVLLDLKMPHLDGIQVMEKLKKIEEDNWFPVMVITAQANHTNRLRALEAGAGDFLGKPYDILELSLRIKNILQFNYLYKLFYQNNRLLEKTIGELTDDLKTANKKINKEVSKRKFVERILKTYNKNLVVEMETEVEDLKSLLKFEH